MKFLFKLEKNDYFLLSEIRVFMYKSIIDMPKINVTIFENKISNYELMKLKKLNDLDFIFKEYFKELFVKNNLTLEFFHSRSNCVSKEYLRIGDDYYPEQHFIKDLSKIKKKYNLDRVLMADDLKVSLQRNYGNLVHVTPFRGDIEDTHLLSLKEYLISIKQEENLRKIEKRYWKDNYNQKTLEHNYKKPKM